MQRPITTGRSSNAHPVKHGTTPWPGAQWSRTIQASRRVMVGDGRGGCRILAPAPTGFPRRALGRVGLPETWGTQSGSALAT